MGYRLPNTFSRRQQLERVLDQVQKLKPAVFDTAQKWPLELQEFTQANNISVFTTTTQANLASYFKRLLQSAPQISLVMAALPNSEEQAELIGWLRSHIHPQAFMHIAQNSDLLAGCIVRTDNMVYDFSLRSSLFAQSDSLAMRLQNG
ncbi:hypothetical protein H0W80_03915 [Candidatus Saccharibacteria bacterium]|nr:hypothetical protein [Candidatus Saccharibacteria bacterium]